MPKSKGAKVYAVARGRAPGIYGTWAECERQTKGYSGAIFKSFKTRFEAEAFMRANSSSSAASSASGAAAETTIATGKKRARDGDAASNQQRKRAAQQQTPAVRNKSNAQLHITIHFDGGSRGNPGVAGAGAEVVVVDRSMAKVEFVPGVVTNIPHRTITYNIREYCGERATNNYAEYKGLLAGLQKAKACIEKYASTQCAKSIKAAAPLIPLFCLEVYGDSNLIIQQLRGAWQCKNPNIMPLYQQSGNLIAGLRSMNGRSEIVLEHVYREQNKVADALANEAMDQRRSWTTATGDSGDIDTNDDRKQAAIPVSAKAGKTNAAQRTATKPQTETVGVEESNDEYYC